MNEKISRNAPCPCGSGKKYKKCCLGKTREERTPEHLAPLTVLHSLYDWTDQGHWFKAKANVLLEHISHILMGQKITYEDFVKNTEANMVEQSALSAFEDFLSREFPSEVPGGKDTNPIDEYLDENGQIESDACVQFLRAMKKSPMSVFEVVETTPGQGVIVRDLLLNTAPVAVDDPNLSSVMGKWDLLATRVVPQGGRFLFSGAMLPFSHRNWTQVVAPLKSLLQATLVAAGASADDPAARMNTLRTMAPRITNLWLAREQEAAYTSPPQLLTSEEEDIELATITMDLADLDPNDVLLSLSQCRELVPLDNEDQAWLWQKPVHASRPDVTAPIGPDEVPDYLVDGGRVYLRDHQLIIESNTRLRGYLLTRTIEDALGRENMAAEPVYANLHTAMEAARPGQDGGIVELPETSKDIISEIKGIHYREWLIAKNPDLQDRTPAEALETETGKAAVLEMLKDAENHELHFAANTGAPLYDIAWVRQALGLD